jgi:nucleotide-binding universal stress UspA family protein
LVGVLAYYAVFEKKAAALEPQVLIPKRPVIDIEVTPSVLVALHNPANVERLIDIAYPISVQRGVRLAAVCVVEVPRQMPIHEGIRIAHHREALLNQAKKHAAERGIALDTNTVIAHHAADGVLTAISDQKAKMLVMGWKGYTNARDRLFGEIADRIIRLAACDLALIKLGKKREWETCLFPTSGGPNARLAATLLSAIARDLKMTVTAGYVVTRDAEPELRSTMDEYLENTLELLDESVPRKKTVIESRSIAGGIARTGRDYDLVVIGAAKEPFFRKMLFGEIPEKVARYAPTSIMVVKKYEGPVKSLLKRLFG